MLRPRLAHSHPPTSLIKGTAQDGAPLGGSVIATPCVCSMSHGCMMFKSFRVEGYELSTPLRALYALTHEALKQPPPWRALCSRVLEGSRTQGGLQHTESQSFKLQSGPHRASSVLTMPGCSALTVVLADRGRRRASSSPASRCRSGSQGRIVVGCNWMELHWIRPRVRC